MKTDMSRIYNSKAFLMIISLIASMAIWLYISSTDEEEMSHVFRGVRVEIVGDDTLRDTKGMVITDIDTNTVTVELTGPRRVVGTLDSGDLVAQIDVSKLSRASYTSQQYKIVYPSGTDTRDLNVSAKSPETVSFVVSNETSKTIPVRGSFDGKMAEGFTAETPVFEPATITVFGAESNLKEISYAWVSFGKNDINSTYEEETGYTLMDKNGDPCQTTGITFSDDSVTARLPVLMLKEVPLDINIVEGAGATQANTVIKIEPESIMLAGDSMILDGMNKIILDTIDLTSFASSFNEEYTIMLDNDIQNITGAKTANVSVQIAGLATKNFTVKNISCTNVTEGYEAEVLSESLEITLRGKEEVLGEIKDDNIRAIADLTDYNESEGTYMPSVKIKVDGFPDVGALGENVISVEIRKVNG